MHERVVISPRRGLPWYVQAGLVVLCLALAGIGITRIPEIRDRLGSSPQQAEATKPKSGNARAFYPTQEQLASLTVATVAPRVFRPEGSTEGKIAVNDDKSTPVFSPYAGRVLKILAKAGDNVKAGQILFTIEVTDMVQAQNDFFAARNGLEKARSQLNLAQIVANRQQELYQFKAVALKEWQSAQNDLIAAQSDTRSAESALQAVRNRLRILGKSDQEIATFDKNGTISPDTPINAPLAGTIVQRKVGPGQYLSANASDPAFVIGDLSTVWLVANVRESEAPKVKVGQQVEVKVLAFPDRVFKAKLTYVAASVDPVTRRLQVRAELDNSEGLLKPEMFATFNIVTGKDETSPSVLRDAIVYEGKDARVWVLRSDNGIEARAIRPGLTDADQVQVLDGLAAGERIIARGSLFIDRAASGEKE